MTNLLMTAKETAKRLNVSYATFRNILATNPDALPRPLIIGKSRRWSEKKVDEWIENGGK